MTYVLIVLLIVACSTFVFTGMSSPGLVGFIALGVMCGMLAGALLHSVRHR